MFSELVKYHVVIRFSWALTLPTHICSFLKTHNSTVNDVLKFRRALTYMDLDYPFSEAFGRASTRNEMILSAEAVYCRLLMLCPGSNSPFFSNVFQILVLGEDGTEDKVKKRAIRNLFRPDADGHLSLLSFVQSCDTVYRRIRYFRASVGNASVIDHVLESIIDIVFYFCLGLIVMSLLNFNPWPLLVSMSTLMVAGSFAIGPTCAKAIEVSSCRFSNVRSAPFQCSLLNPVSPDHRIATTVLF
jgi:hypothetical protein